MSLITNDYEAFLFVKNHLLTQNAKAMSDSDDCLYRGYSDITLNAAREEAYRLAKEQVEDWVDTEDLQADLFYDILPTKNCDAMCAVGCLISDDFYSQDFEGRTIERSCQVWDAVKLSNPLWKMTDASHEMLKKLQSVHDNNDPEDWEVLLSRFSTSFDKYGDYEMEKEND